MWRRELNERVRHARPVSGHLNEAMWKGRLRAKENTEG
jgi:hypothetical protein